MDSDFRIPRASVHGLDDASLYWALIEPVWPDASVSLDDDLELEHIAKATPGQRALYVTTLFVREVDNGGLEQFFHNSSGLYAESVHEAFRVLKADNHEAAFERALSIFPGGKAPVDWEDRNQVLDSIPKQVRRELFESLDEQLQGEHRLWPIFRDYVAEHPNEFFVD